MHALPAAATMEHPSLKPSQAHDTTLEPPKFPNEVRPSLDVWLSVEHSQLLSSTTKLVENRQAAVQTIGTPRGPGLEPTASTAAESMGKNTLPSKSSPHCSKHQAEHMTSNLLFTHKSKWFQLPMPLHTAPPTTSTAAAHSRPPTWSGVRGPAVVGPRRQCMTARSQQPHFTALATAAAESLT